METFKKDMKHILGNIRTHFMNGVSYMLPCVVAGGVLMAVALLLAGGIEIPEIGYIRTIYEIGGIALGLMVPVMSGYIAYSIADRAALAAGFTGGLIANQIGAGFLGGLISGILAGIVVYYLKKIKFPIELKSIGSIIVVPIISVLTIGSIMFAIGGPIAGIMNAAESFLIGINQNQKVLFGMVMGAMLAFDMGGPVNKVVFSLMVSTIGDGIYSLAGPIAVGIAVPPIACGVAALIGKKKFTEAERNSSLSSIIMGGVGITEGAIPYAAADPVRVIPCLMVGNGIGVVTAYLMNVGTHAAWGGLITLPVVTNRMGFVIAHIVGVIATVILLLLVKKELPETEEVNNHEDENVELEMNF